MKYKYKIGEIVMLKSKEECQKIEEENYHNVGANINTWAWGSAVKITKQSGDRHPIYYIEDIPFAFDELWFEPTYYQNKLKEFIDA